MYKILYIHRYSTIHINCQVSDSVFVISSINPICFLCIYYKNNVQIIFVRWRGDSEIVEANAEHGFRLKKLIGMLCTTTAPFFVQSAKQHCRADLLTPESHMVKKCLRHFMKNLRFFLNLCPSGEGLSYMDSGVKRSSRQCRLADCTKKFVQVAFVRWRGDSKIVEANAEHDFRLKRLIGMFRTTKRAQYFCAICQATLPG